MYNHENELKEEFAKIEKMNSRERLSYIRDYIKFHDEMVKSGMNYAEEAFSNVVERIMLVTKGCDQNECGSFL